MINILQKFLKEKYGIEIQLTPLLGGADANATLYKGVGDTNDYFIKVKNQFDPHSLLSIAHLLQNAGIKEIIYPVKALNGSYFENLENKIVLVYPFIDGEDGFHKNLTLEQWTLLGMSLKKIHEISVPASLGIRRESFSDKWRKQVSRLLNKEDFFPKYKMTIQKLLDNAEILSKKVDLSSPFILCHADIHGGNVLIDNHNGIYIVDWDDPILAPKERDLMFVGGGVGNVWNKTNQEEAFFRGYGKESINSLLIAYYRHERILEDVVEYYHLLKDSPNDPEFNKQFNAQFDSNGVVDIAFKSFDI